MVVLNAILNWHLMIVVRVILLHNLAIENAIQILLHLLLSLTVIITKITKQILLGKRDFVWDRGRISGIQWLLFMLHFLFFFLLGSLLF